MQWFGGKLNKKNSCSSLSYFRLQIFHFPITTWTWCSSTRWLSFNEWEILHLFILAFSVNVVCNWTDDNKSFTNMRAGRKISQRASFLRWKSSKSAVCVSCGVWIYMESSALKIRKKSIEKYTTKVDKKNIVTNRNLNFWSNKTSRVLFCCREGVEWVGWVRKEKKGQNHICILTFQLFLFVKHMNDIFQ